jgi:hypothetical protein
VSPALYRGIPVDGHYSFSWIEDLRLSTCWDQPFDPGKEHVSDWRLWWGLNYRRPM